MRLPNRYGTVTRLSGRRRKPWIVREGQTGQQRPIGYAATKGEALSLLAKYNQTPWDIDGGKLTVRGLYQLFAEKKAGKLGRSSLIQCRSAMRHVGPILDLPYSTVKAYQMQACIDGDGSNSYSVQVEIKTLFHHLDRFAVELDIVQRTYSQILTTCQAPETRKMIFTADEIARLWVNQRIDWADSVIFLLFTGFRISEALNVQVADIDWQEMTIRGGCKTAAGKGRIVPINDKIAHLVQVRAKSSKSGALFELDGAQIKLPTYRHKWAAIMDQLGMDHTPHECRHTFRSCLDSAGANKVCIDRLMGHVSQGTGERVYTHKTIEELRQAIALIDYHIN